MRKLLLTMLVALLTVPVFAQTTPAVNGQNQATVSFGNANVPSVSNLTTTVTTSSLPQFEITGFMNGGGEWNYIGTGSKLKKIVSTIEAKNAWDRPLKSITFDILDVVGTRITDANVTMVSTGDEEVEVAPLDITDDISGAKANSRITVDVSSYASNFTESYILTIEITTKAGGTDGATLKLNGLTFEFYDPTEVPTEPSIAWPANTRSSYEVTIPATDDDYTVVDDVPTNVILTNARGADVEYHSLNTDVATVYDFEAGRYTLKSVGNTQITASITVNDVTYTTQPFTLIVKAIEADLKFNDTSFTAPMGATPSGFPKATATYNGTALKVKYTSGDTSIAEVDPTTGALTLNAVGTTRIKAEVDEARYTADPVYYTLNVTSGFDWVGDVPSGAYYYGQQITLPAVKPATGVTGELEVTYTSNNSAISIDNTAKTAKVVNVVDGSITITATVKTTSGTNLGTRTFTVSTRSAMRPSLSFANEAESVVYTATNIELPALILKASTAADAPVLDIDMSKVTYSDDARTDADVEKIGNKYYLVFKNFDPAKETTIVVTANLPANVGDDDLYGAASATYSITIKPAIKWEGVADAEYSGYAGTTLTNAPVAVLTDGNDTNFSIKYESSSPRVAIVDDNGKVDLLKAGETTISAIAQYNGADVQELSYKVVVTRNVLPGYIYASSDNFNYTDGYRTNPTLTPAVNGDGGKFLQDIQVKFTGRFNKSEDGVVTVTSDTLVIYTTDPAVLAYKKITIDGNLTGGELVTSPYSDFSVVTEKTSQNEDGTFDVEGHMHDLYYKITFQNAKGAEFNSVEFEPVNTSAATIEPAATPCAMLAVINGDGKEPDTLKNFEITTDNFDANSPQYEGAYSAGQAVFVNFVPTDGATVYYLVLAGNTPYAAKYAESVIVPIEGTIINDAEGFNIDWSGKNSTVNKSATDKFNKYATGEYIFIGDDNSSNLKVSYFTQNGDVTSDIKTISFSGTTGVEDIMVDEEAGEAVYYNLQGVQIAHPAKGQIYVRVMGKKVDKVVF